MNDRDSIDVWIRSGLGPAYPTWCRLRDWDEAWGDPVAIVTLAISPAGLSFWL